MALKVLESGQNLSMREVAKVLRLQRHGSIQMITQFVYMHSALISLAVAKKAVTLNEINSFNQEYMEYMQSVGVFAS